MKRFFLIASIVAVLFPGIAGGQVLPFTHYTPDSELNPLPSAEVHQVYQDREGFMWFAIYSSGIVRYNGVTMEVYGTEDGLTDLTVWDLLEDSTGRLWVSSNAGIVVSEKPLAVHAPGERITFTSEVNGVSLINVTVNHNRMDVDTEGWVWIGTENLGLVRYRFTEDGSLRSDTLSTKTADSETNISVRSLIARNDGSVWVSVLGGRLLKYENDAITGSIRTNGSGNINALYESRTGVLYGGEQTGRVWRLDEQNERARFVEIDPGSGSNIADIMTGSDGTIWISSEGAGFLKIDPENNQKVNSISRENGLLSEIVFNIYEDREENVWIAQSGGVSKLRYNFKAFRNLTAVSLAGEQPVLPSPSINTILPSEFPNNPCWLWAGSSEGGIACINENMNSVYIQDTDGLTANWVNGLAYDASGRLWVGTSRGLNSITFPGVSVPADAYDTNRTIISGTQAQISTFDANSVLAVDKLMMGDTSVPENRTESIWFPAYHAVYVMVKDQFYTLDSSVGLPAAIYHGVAFDGEGYLWVGTRDRGIYRSTQPFTYQLLSEIDFSEGGNELFEAWWTIDNGAPSNQIEKLLFHDGLMWVGTPGGLAALEDATTSERYLITTNDGLRANNATSFALSPVSGNLWVGTNQGLAEIDPATGTVINTVTRSDGLVDNEVWFYGSVNTDADGVVYFGTAKGISIYNPMADRKNTHPPKLKLTNFISEEIRGERNEFIFEYAALSFGNEREVRYQTRLVGFNDEWTPKKSDTRVNYTNLSALFLPKEYQFEVLAVNESGVESAEILSEKFLVSPPFYLSWWAFLMYFIFISAGIFVVDRIQRARLIKKEREAAYLRETELKAETAIARSNAAEAQAKALRAENDLKAAELEKARELEQAYHELKSTQKRLIQAEKMASLGRLSTGIAHEIKNPLNFINNFSEVSRELVDELKIAIQNNDENEIEYILENLSFNTQKIDEHGKRADSIVRSMMQHSRGGQGDFESVDLNKLIKEYTDLAYHGKKSQINKLDVLVHTQLDSAVKQVHAIPQKIGQVLQNIVENAIDSVWEHSKRLNGEYKPEIVVRSQRSNGQVVVKISDNGPGIPEHIKEKIFEPFFTTKPTGEGTGLGLSLSYDFITQIHNGKLEVGDSELGGALFTITLPESNKSGT